MSYYPSYYHPPPSACPPTAYPPPGYISQACTSPACYPGMQHAHTHLVQVHPPPPLGPEQWITPGQPLPRHTSHRPRYESEAFEADVHPSPHSRRNVHSQTCDYSTATSTDSEEVIETRHDYREKPKPSTRSRRVLTIDDSSQPEHAQRYIGSQPTGADKQAKGSSAKRAGTERKQTMNQSTRTQLPKPNSKRRPEEPSEQKKERTSTNTAYTERAHSTSHSSRTNAPVRPMKFLNKEDVNIRLPDGSCVRFTGDGEIETIAPAENSSGRSIKEKSKESSRGNQGKEGNKKMAGKSSQNSRGNDGNNKNAKKPSQHDQGTKHNKVKATEPSRDKQNTERSIIQAKGPSRGSRNTQLTMTRTPNYYAIIGCEIGDNAKEITEKVKNKNAELLSRRTSRMTKQEKKKFDDDSALIKKASRVLEDEERRLDYDQAWLAEYGK